MRYWICILALSLLSACGTRNPLARWVPSPNYGPRTPILVVLHATEQESVGASLLTLRTRNSGGRVSAHYLIGRDGRIYQLVADEHRAWHAGAGSWGTITDVNSASIGIELDNNGTDAFPPAQIDSLLRLLEDLCTRLKIPRHQVIGHADMAPTRKSDPGAQFPWATLAAAGFGRWPPASGRVAAPRPGFDPLVALRVLGYPMDDVPAAIRAFHRHFRGIESDAATLDMEDVRILHALQSGHVDPSVSRESGPSSGVD